jgi:uncharacterized protein
VPIGRIAFTMDALPAVQPVAFAMYDGQVVIRTRQHSELVTRVRDTIVAFQVDEYDPKTLNGWSVTVVGQAITARTPQLIERLTRLQLRSWQSDGVDDFVLISVMMVRGCRVNRSAQEAPELCNGLPRPDA